LEPFDSTRSPLTNDSRREYTGPESPAPITASKVIRTQVTRTETHAAPVTNDAVTIGLERKIAANDLLRTGTYSETLAFTLSTTRP
jgi:hypothetical protein